jgi:hypothetical protein
VRKVFMSRIACFLAVKKESIHDTICTRSTRPRQITNVDKGGEPTCGSAAQHWQQSV